MPADAVQQGRIVAAHGRHYMVVLADGTQRECFPRGKRSELAVGDEVMVRLQGENQGSIETRLPRRNLVYRSDDFRSKQFAANVDQLLLVIATDPPFSEELAGRALVAARSADIEPLILLNKTDLAHLLPAARERLAAMLPAELEVPVIEVQATDTAATRAQLLPLLKGRTSLLLGQSAMGKSTILNALVPDADAATQEHSQALGAGRHTTTATRLYPLPDDTGEDAGELIDSPGFQNFGLQHLEIADLVRSFPEFDTAAACRFDDCSHRHEPGCEVKRLLEQGRIKPARYQLYTRLLAELEARPAY
ncbi:MAG: ribosome small subunit-dependent GTPase A [Castellaniella sp.]